MDENVVAAAVRRPGSEMLHVFFVWLEGCGLAKEWAEREVLELAGLMWWVELVAGSLAGAPAGRISRLHLGVWRSVTGLQTKC